jgi:hypothetical protein
MRNLILTVVNLAAYAVAAMAVFVLSPAADLSLPWWVALTAPAVVYTLLVKMCCPRANTAEAIGVVALLFVAHAALASATGMVYAAFTALPYPAAFAVAAWEYLPAPILQLLCVSLLVLPFRTLYASPRSRRRRSFAAMRASADAAGAPLRSASDLPPSPFVTPDLPESPAAPPTGPASDGFAGGSVSQSTGIPPIAGGSRRDGAERVEEVVAIPFSRIAAQLPAGAFTIPPERLGANLLEPGHLLVPTRLLVPQLADGHVTVTWEEVADQFPRHALAVNEATVRDGLPEGRIVLPLDEVIRRLPPELFAPNQPGADMQALERFPLPFRPVEPDPVMPAAPPEPPPAAPAAPSRPEPVMEAAPPVVNGAPSATGIVPPGADQIEVEPSRPVPSEAARPAPEPPAPAAEYIPPFLVAEREIEYGLGGPSVEPAVIDEPAPVAMPPVEAPPVMEVAPPSPVAPAAPPPIERPPIAVPHTPAPRFEMPPAAPVEQPVPVPRPSVSGDREWQASQLAAVLTPFGALEVSSTGIEGVTLFTFASGALPSDAVLRTAASVLPFLMSGRAPWAVDQLTVRREGGAIIITPLGSVESGGPAMVASVGRVGSLALLEIVCLKAAREHRLAFPGASRREPAAPTVPTAQYETRKGGGLSLGFLAGDLDAFGAVAPTVLRDSAGGNEVCVFLAPGGDSRVVAGFSVDVCRALVEGDEPALGPLQSVTFRLGERRLVVRPVKGTPGRFSVLVAAGEAVDRPGLAHRQLERAAALLRSA